MNWDHYTKYAPFVVRLGLGLVLLWFGIDALLNPGVWSTLVPKWILGWSHLSADTFMYLNGVIEIILGLLLLIGLWTRLAAMLTACLLLGILLSLGYGDLAVRDFGLFLGAISLLCSGSGWGGLDSRKGF
ncbi:MAG TPA: DoxX family membrane protein [Candidatus Nanoarchaeia archaeon]|nr:DoxX family membrane protein [Candidatus Nanoarchaeia archaeon]